VGGHGGGGVMVGGSQMVSHGGGQLAEENSEDDSPVLVLASRKECKHLIHEMGQSSVLEEWHIQESVDLLPLRLAVANGQACFQLLISIESVWLHRIHQVSN
jgi:hypothetical protein